MALGDLVVNLTANTVQFTGAMDKAAYLAQKNVRRMKKDINLAGKVIGAALVTAATTFGYAMKKIIDDADELNKMSQKIGVSVQSLSAFRYAADLAGSSFEGLTKGVARFTRNISDAQAGLATPRRAFDFLNISIENSEGALRSTEDLLLEVADRFSKMGDGVKKAALAQELFGRSGVELIPFLNQGKAGIEAVRKEAEELGIVFDERTAKAAENLNDNITRLSNSLRGKLITVAAEIVPILVDLSDQMVDSAKQTDKFSDAGTSLADVLMGLITVGNYVAATYKTIGTAVKNGAAGLILAAQGNFKALGELSKSSSDEMVENYEDAFEKTRQIFEKQFARENGFADGSIQPSDVANFEGISAAMKKMESEGGALKKALRMPKEVLHDDLEGYRNLLKAGAIDQETFTRAVKRSKEEFQEQSSKIKEVNGFMRDLGATFSSAFEDAIVEGGKFSDVLRGLEKDIIRIGLRKAVTDPLMGGIFGDGSSGSGGIFNKVLSSIVGGFMGGGMSFGGVSSTGTSLGSQVSAFGGGVSAFASGGILGGPMAFPMAGNKTGLAGEAGPEAILPLMRTSSGDLGVKSGGGGGGTIVNVYAPPGSNVKQERDNDGGVDRINIFIDEAVAGNMRPGTKTYKAIKSSFAVNQRLTPR